VQAIADQLERARRLLGDDARFMLAMRGGYHEDMLAIGLAGTIARDILAAYQTRRAAAGAGAVEPLEIGPLVTLLQRATQSFVRRSEGIAALQQRAHEQALRCVLDEWLAAEGIAAVAGLDDADFAAAFGARARASDRCAGRVHLDVLTWTSEVARQAVDAAGLERFELADLERLLGLRPLEPTDFSRLLAEARPAIPKSFPQIFQDGLAPIPTNQAAWALIAAIHDAVMGRNWSDTEGRSIPTHRTPTNSGRGAVEVSLREAASVIEPEPAALAQLWEQVRALSDLTSDTLLVCLAAWTTDGGRPDQPVWVTADAILDARGVQRIQKRGEPTDWQHGHRREDRLAAGRALAQLDQLWLEVVDVEVLPGNRRRSATKLSVESRAMTILDRVTERDADGAPTFLAARVLPGEWVRAWWDLGLRQVGLLAQAALTYDPYRELPEKRLAKYLAFSFRWNARRRGEPLARRVTTLLTNAGLEADPARPQRTRDRLEKALTRLTEDGVLAGWRYQRDPGDLPARRWLPLWCDMLVSIEPPDVVVAGNSSLRRGGVE
jgi:hypothetical protein